MGLMDFCSASFSFLASWYALFTLLPPLHKMGTKRGDKKTKESRQASPEAELRSTEGLQAQWKQDCEHMTWGLGILLDGKRGTLEMEDCIYRSPPLQSGSRDTSGTAVWVMWSEASTCVYSIHRCHLSSLSPLEASRSQPLHPHIFNLSQLLCITHVFFFNLSIQLHLYFMDQIVYIFDKRTHGTWKRKIV